jgi:single-stranded-DNA-specific exonuclease
MNNFFKDGLAHSDCVSHGTIPDMSAYHWPEPLATRNAADAHSPLVARLLANRNVPSELIDSFLNPCYDTGLVSPSLLHDIDAAAERLEQVFKSSEHITIFADYDCDGIPGAVVAHDFLTHIKHEQFTTYIPHRHYEGFGLTVKAIEKIHQSGSTLIVTIDCGVTDVAAVERANELGIDVIITDHHEPGEVLPPAAAIVNPKLGDYPFRDLCGAAVLFKLVQHLLARGSDSDRYNAVAGYEKWWLDMVGLATIADMVPLVGENRVLATYGLRVLRKSRRPGLRELLRAAGADQRFLEASDVGFTIGPRINAASRMDAPDDAFAVLTARTPGDATERVRHLEGLNTSRKTAVAQITKALNQNLKGMDIIPDVIVFGDPSWRPSLVGLVAGKLAEQYARPVFLWGTDGNGAYKGSCRGGGGVSVVALMRAASDAFVMYGGHHVAGGFTVAKDQIFTLAAQLNQAAGQTDARVPKETIVIDAALQLDEVTPLLVRELEQLAPYGMGNHEPIFALRGVRPQSVEQFGKTNEHLKLTFTTESGALEAIAFFSTPSQYALAPVTGHPCTLIAHVEESRFRGRTTVRLRIIDVVPYIT